MSAAPELVPLELAGFEGRTERLRLRPYAASDLPAFADLHARPEVARYLPWLPRDRAASAEALAKNVERVRLGDADSVVVLAAFDVESGRLAGDLYLFVRNVISAGGEVGYALHPDFRGRGLATEGARAMLEIGFDRARMHRVIARIDVRNLASAAVLDRLGMRREAVLVKNELFKGEWTDEADYAILAEEWAARPQRVLLPS